MNSDMIVQSVVALQNTKMWATFDSSCERSLRGLRNLWIKYDTVEFIGLKICSIAILLL